MASLLIRKIDDDVKSRLRQQATEHGRSLEAEARHIISSALRQETSGAQIVRLAREIFGPENGVELEPHPPVYAREPPDFS